MKKILSQFFETFLLCISYQWTKTIVHGIYAKRQFDHLSVQMEVLVETRRGSRPKSLRGLVPTSHPVVGNPVPLGKSITGNWGA